ncbi:MAG: hypothetical protein ACRDNX_06735 [Gaiellaceae bacterium]
MTRARVVDLGGQLVLAGGLGLFLLALGLRDWYWPRFGVPGGTGFGFLDLRFFTSAWECARRGIEVVETNPCDPAGRAMNYPRIWLAPAPLGLGQAHTVVLGAGLIAVFVASVFAAIGRIRPGDGLVYAAALCSPAVLLGVERANPDVLVFAIVVAGLLLLRVGSVPGVAAAHGLLLLAAVLKLYPVLAWGPLLRQPRRRLLLGLGGVAAAFAVYALATRHDIRRIGALVPEDVIFSYGAGILGDEGAGRIGVLVAGSLAALGLVALARRRGSPAAGAATEREQRDLDLFWAGAGVFLGTYALAHNYNYRLAFCLLTLPQLLRWSRDPQAPVPFAALGVTSVLASLWLGASISAFPLGIGEWWEDVLAGFPYDELVNVLLFGYLAGALVLTLPRPLFSLLRPDRRTRPARPGGAHRADRSPPARTSARP